MNGFIKSTGFTDKTVVIATVRGFSKPPTKAHKYLSDLVESKNGKVVKILDIHGASVEKTASEGHIKNQIKNI